MTSDMMYIDLRKKSICLSNQNTSVVLRMFTINDYTESREDRLMI